MNHALAAQAADLLPTRLTLATFGRPFDASFDARPFDGLDDDPNFSFTNVDANNFAIALRGPAVALQNINVR